jgi:hypothetical protein
VVRRHHLHELHLVVRVAAACGAACCGSISHRLCEDAWHSARLFRHGEHRARQRLHLGLQQRRQPRDHAQLRSIRHTTARPQLLLLLLLLLLLPSQ